MLAKQSIVYTLMCVLYAFNVDYSTSIFLEYVCFRQQDLLYEMFNKKRTLHNMTIVNRNWKSWYATLLTVLNNLESEYILHDFNITFTI